MNLPIFSGISQESPRSCTRLRLFRGAKAWGAGSDQLFFQQCSTVELQSKRIYFQSALGLVSAPSALAVSFLFNPSLTD